MIETQLKDKNKITILPEEYYQKKVECEFDSMQLEYFSSIEDLADINLQIVQDKEKYIKYQFVLQEKKS